MPITIDEIKKDVLQVLKDAKKGETQFPQYMTAYQILSKLKKRDEIIADYGYGMKGSGKHYSGPVFVAKACEKLHDEQEIDIEWLDCTSIMFDINGTQGEAGNPVSGIYRIKR